MDNLNLVVKFMLAADGLLQVKGASRIKVDGRGGLLLYDAQGGSVETIQLGELVRSLRCRHWLERGIKKGIFQATLRARPAMRR
jgi:hypothetical protein